MPNYSTYVLAIDEVIQVTLFASCYVCMYNLLGLNDGLYVRSISNFG